MPYLSKAQQGWAHTPAGTKALGGPAKVHEWDKATKGKYGSLPGHVPSHAQGGQVMSNKGYMGKTESFAAGGPVLGKESKFLKATNEFTDPDEGEQGDSADEDQKYAKSGEGAGKGFIKPPAAKDKSLKPIKPRK